MCARVPCIFAKIITAPKFSFAVSVYTPGYEFVTKQNTSKRCFVGGRLFCRCEFAIELLEKLLVVEKCDEIINAMYVYAYVHTHTHVCV